MFVHPVLYPNDWKKLPIRDMAALRRKFEDIYVPSHPLRAALQKLHTLDPIRIIEGKA